MWHFHDSVVLVDWKQQQKCLNQRPNKCFQRNSMWKIWREKKRKIKRNMKREYRSFFLTTKTKSVDKKCVPASICRKNNSNNNTLLAYTIKYIYKQRQEKNKNTGKTDESTGCKDLQYKVWLTLKYWFLCWISTFSFSLTGFVWIVVLLLVQMKTGQEIIELHSHKNVFLKLSI